MLQSTLENQDNDLLLARLGELTKDLLFTSESDYPLEPVSLPTPLTNERLIECAQLQSPTGTNVEQRDWNEFLRHHTCEEKDRMFSDLTSARQFQALESFMNEELEDIHVYRIGDEPRIVILALGTTKDRQQLIGFRTVSIET